MKIAIATSDNQIKGYVHPHFGRCNWFCVVDTDTGGSEFYENTARMDESEAGSKAVGLLLNIGINLVIAGHFGSKSIEALRANKVQMIIPEIEIQVKTLINQFIQS